VRLGLLAGSKGLWWAARISNTERWDEITSGRYIGFPYKTGYITLDARPNLPPAQKG
jgi:hypothetical protein